MESDTFDVETGRTDAEMIDWCRVAEPQPDLYDCHVALSFQPTEFIKQLGKLRIEKIPRSIGEGLVAAPLNHPNIERALSLLRIWPTAYDSVQKLIKTFYPLVHSDEIQRGRGSTCGSNDEYLGEIYATVFSAEGLADAFVHEFGHTKLRYLGIWLEHADRLITNKPNEVFSSPLRKDILRPMSAVFHAEYSYTYITELDLRMLEADPTNIGHRQAIEVNYGRLREGEKEIKAHLKTDKKGEQFFTGYFDWLDRVLNQCVKSCASGSNKDSYT